MSYDDFKTKLGFGSRPTLFEIVFSPPDAVIKAMGLDPANVVKDMKLSVKGSQIPGKTIGEIIVPYEGEDVKIAGDVTYDALTYTFINDVSLFVRDIIDAWTELIASPRTNIRATPVEYKQTLFIYQINNKKERVKGWEIDGGFPTAFDALEKNWETKDTIDEGTFTISYDKYHRLDASGSRLLKT